MLVTLGGSQREGLSSSLARETRTRGAHWRKTHGRAEMGILRMAFLPNPPPSTAVTGPVCAIHAHTHTSSNQHSSGSRVSRPPPPLLFLFRPPVTALGPRCRIHRDPLRGTKPSDRAIHFRAGLSAGARSRRSIREKGSRRELLYSAVVLFRVRAEVESCAYTASSPPARSMSRQDTAPALPNCPQGERERDLLVGSARAEFVHLSLFSLALRACRSLSACER